MMKCFGFFQPIIFRSSHRSYADSERQLRQESLELGEGKGEALSDNSELKSEGEALISDYVKAFLRHNYPYLFEEYILSVHDNLTSEQALAYVGAHIGVKDLILSSDFPPELETIANTFKSVVGALKRSQVSILSFELRLFLLVWILIVLRVTLLFI